MGKKKKITKTEKQWIKDELNKLSSENSFRLKQTIEPNSNFINISQGYFNKGKYKGTPVSKAPMHYLKWVMENIELNKGETSLLNKLIKQKP
jgi:uncharacterized protein (DUF3820 family)